MPPLFIYPGRVAKRPFGGRRGPACRIRGDEKGRNAIKKRNIAYLLLALALALLLLTGCSGGQKSGEEVAGKTGRVAVTMYMWDRSMFKELSPWLEEKFPEIDFTFVQSFNTMEYYKDLLSRGEAMPDIITCRRFSLNDAAPLAGELMDLSKTEVAGTF